MNTEFGKIAHLTQSVGSDLSPLQKEMDNVTKQISFIAIGIGILFLIIAITLAKINPRGELHFRAGNDCSLCAGKVFCQQ